MEEETRTIKIPYGYEFDRVEDGKVILKKKEVKLLKNYTDCLHSIKFEGFPEWFPNVSVPQGMLKPIYFGTTRYAETDLLSMPTSYLPQRLVGAAGVEAGLERLPHKIHHNNDQG